MALGADPNVQKILYTGSSAPSDGAAGAKRVRVFMDIALGTTPLGRVTMELFADAAPRTVENFRCLCTGEKGASTTTRQTLHFKGSIFHRIIPGFMAQGGDITRGDGTGGESIYGARFSDERSPHRHNKPYMLSMANAGPDTNGSQFFITFVPAPWLDGKHVVFGQVIDGQTVVQRMEKVVTGANDTPRVPVRVVDCGELLGDGTVSDARSVIRAALAAQGIDAPAELDAATGNANASTEHAVLTAPMKLHGSLRTDSRELTRAMKDAGLPITFGRSKRNAPAGSTGGTETAVSSAVAAEEELAALIRERVKAQAAESKGNRGMMGAMDEVDDGEDDAAAAKRAFTHARVPAASSKSLAASLRHLSTMTSSAPTTSASSEPETDVPSEAPAEVQASPPVTEPADTAAPATDDAADDGNEQAPMPGVSSAAQERLFALRLRMNAGRKANHAAVLAEHRRAAEAAGLHRPRDPGAAGRNSIGVPPAVAGVKRRREGDGKDKRSGEVDPDALPAYLLEPSAVAEAKAEARAEKEQRIVDSHGWNRFGEAAEARSYDKRVKAIPAAAPAAADTSIIPFAAGESLLASESAAAVAVTAAYGSATDVDPAGVRRMVKELETRHAANARHSSGPEAMGVTEDNRRYNRKLAKDYDKYTVEIRRNLERGTA